MTNWKIIKKKLQGNTSPEEEKYLQKWLARNKSNKALLDQLMAQWPKSPVEDFDSESAFRKLKNRIDQDSPRSQGSTLSLGRAIAIAASLSAIVFCSWFYINQYKEKSAITTITRYTERGQRLTISLPDGSTVDLNSESSVSYPETFSDDRREILLKGEAFFNVTKNPGRPFIVHTGVLTTKVLGTSFNIHAYDPVKMQVAVKTGLVEVSLKSDTANDSVLLEPGQQARYDISNPKLTRNEISLEDVLAWKHRIILIQQKTLEETTRILSRWYDVEFVFLDEDIKSRIINGEFNDDSLENIMKNIQFLTNIEYKTTSGKKIILSASGNN